MDRDTRSPAAMWQTVLGHLQLQLPRETFNTWLRGARLLAYEDGTFIIGVDNVYAREWLEHRLKRAVLRTLEQVAGRTCEVRFVIWRERRDEDPADIYEAGPLLAEIAPPREEAPRFERLAPGETGLNPRLVFEGFGVGGANRLAQAAAAAVVEMPGQQFNPLYIYGGVGLGKTHLLHAVGNAAQAHRLRVLYVTGETFTNDLVGAIRGRSTAELREKYREVDMLLVDDLQFIAGKESTQEEFSHTFDTLANAGAQIVLAASQHPAEMTGLDPGCAPALKGLVLEVLPPDFLTRVDILEIKARQRGFEARLGLDILESIAERVEGSVRELEGALNRVIAAAMLTGSAPTLHEAQTALSDIPRKQGVLSLDDIVMAVADYYGVPPEDVVGRDRSRAVSTARQVAMYIAREEADCSLQQIGEALGGRNHSTVLYSCERVADLLATDSQIKRHIRAILQILRPGIRGITEPEEEY